MYVDPTLYTTAPEDGRACGEMAVYAKLDALGIPYTRCDHDAANTMSDCLAVEAVLGVPVCKNLLLTNRKQTDFYLLMMPGDKPFKTRDLTAQLGCARLSFATPEHMAELLGAAPGSASGFELLNDTECRVRLLMDRELLSGEFISGHPCFSTSTLKIRLGDFLERFLPAVGHRPTSVDLPRYAPEEA